MKEKILVGLSGGVDSAVSAYLLKKQGYDVTAGFMINYLAPEGEYCETREDIKIAKEVAEFLKIPFFTFDYRDEYEKKVLNYMYEGYKKGITPNPDIMCNSEIKFKIFLEEALELGFDKIATGHYARIVKSEKLKVKSNKEENYIYHLLKGMDKTKDQSYFLAGLNQEQLSKAIFPIGDLEKKEVRRIAQDIGLPNANRKDSQGICFVGKVDFKKFLEKKIKHKKGNIIDTSGNILGEHNGVFYYTTGQRKGLDIGGLKKPVFVIKKDIIKNELIVGTEDDIKLYDDKLILNNIHFLADKIKLPFRGKAKIRYRQEDKTCLIKENIEGKYEVRFEEKQRAISPGQICAIYNLDELVISGVIN